MGDTVETSDVSALMAAELDRTATERRLFETNADGWAQSHKDEWVLIKGSRAHGFFASFEDAFEAGDRLFPEEDLFIKRVGPSGAAEPVSLGLLHGVLIVDE